MRENERKHWTDSELDKLDFMAKSGFSTPSIAKNLGRTEAAIYTKASQEDISLLPKDK